jgi:hypothetical protein
MREKLSWSILLLALLGLACQRGEPARHQAAPVMSASPTPMPSVEAMVEQFAEAQRPAAKLSSGALPVQSLALASTNRAEGLQSRELRIHSVQLNKRPQAGALVTIIPLGLNLAATQTRIASVKAIENPCSRSLPRLWEVAIEPLTQEAYVKAPSANTSNADGDYYPFDVCVIYPAVEQAQLLNRGLLEVATLPAKTLLENVELAVDLNRDRKPELVLVKFCCGKPQLRNSDCDQTCEKVYLLAAGAWQELDSRTPC